MPTPPPPGRSLALLACGLAAASGAARAQVAHPEAEPNDTKTLANAVTLPPGDWIAGTSTGADSSGSATSADYFLVRTAAGTAGIYRHRLTLSTAGAIAHTGMIR